MLLTALAKMERVTIAAESSFDSDFCSDIDEQVGTGWYVLQNETKMRLERQDPRTTYSTYIIYIINETSVD